ncbi:hypothetical protein VOLCADRAFT_89650 [Volvox carteri f. nagariensis]|uniref:Uncharacterized protein n=1 Tax=Volvox carteri f. nagariensis TaxID=3068 RepID=D8TSE7_VOLCA|nr:uncharacterized protein VOLCADRAFT_89650 [Volvox carteri f. nagariensis]EFJ49809.1 hypothetical protein VOLCADRAFT_89650 [Volvox carteri f. nagariensis]|eukprot:XP_002949316.1 hypothetical protein VOLCADRAFT_89650 [Volvox carteri f. nagariensis]
MQQRLILRLVTLLGLASALTVQASVNDLNGQAGPEPAADVQRRQLQERNRDAIFRLRSLLAEHLSQTPATVTPYPPRPANRRRRLLSPARPAYATQCLYEPPPPPSTEPLSPPSTPSSPSAPPPPPSSGRCYLNPMVVAHPDFPEPVEPTNPIEIMLLKTAWTAYQCSFEKRRERCGTYRHPPYDCRWQEDQNRCAVTSDYLLPRLLAYLHCRDDAVLTPFWDRCYTVGKLTGDSDWCGQPDGNWARCWWFPARDGTDEEDVCAPSPQGGVESREAYDELVSQMRNGIWQRDWFGSCDTADLVYTIKSSCNYTTPQDCENDELCTARSDLPVEYGMCRLRDDLIWQQLSQSVRWFRGGGLLGGERVVDKVAAQRGRSCGLGSELFEATAAAQAECANASTSRETCMEAGSWAPEAGGAVPLDPDKFSDVIDLVFIEEGAAMMGSGAPSAAAAALGAAAAVPIADAATASCNVAMW